ncbi:hypothetical protein POSPLADRAFT_1039587, partial [Postia placenta MAD-698-R-SB12]
STFAQALEHYVPGFRRCNQDDLGNRQNVESLARQCLRDGLSVCIDRTNFDARQRATWINIAHEFPDTPAWVIVFDTPYEVCAQRLRERKDHPNIKTPEEGLSILARFRSQYQPPSAHEGFSRILYLRPSDHPSREYTQSDITEILRRVEATPPPTNTIDTYFTPQSSLGHSGRGYGGFRGRRYPGFRGAPGHVGYGRGAPTPNHQPQPYGQYDNDTRSERSDWRPQPTSGYSGGNVNSNWRQA